MNKSEAQLLSREIEKKGVTITGLRHYGRGSYALDCTGANGIPFVVNNREEWLRRIKDAAEYG